VLASGVAVLLLLASAGHAADITTIARTGQLASGQGLEEFHRFLTDNNNDPLPEPLINENGTCLFLASLHGPGATASTDKAVYLRGPAGGRVVARRYHPIPNSVDVVFSEFFNVGLGRSHDTAVLFTVLGGSGVAPGIDNAGVFSATWTSSQMVARMGDAAPDAVPAANFTGFQAPLVPGQGTGPLVPARVRLAGSGASADGIWMPSLTDAVRIQQFGPAPGTIGAIFAAYEAFSESHGSPIYRATLVGGDVSSITVNGTLISNSTGLWLDEAQGTPVLVARTAQPLTANPLGPVISALHTGSIGPATSSGGGVVFSGAMVNRQTGAPLGIGVWRWADGSRTELFTTGTPIAGQVGLTVSAFSGMSSGRVLFAGDDGSAWGLVTLAGAGVAASNDCALVRTVAGGGVSMLARGGSPAPGCAAGQTFTNAVLGGTLRAAPAGKVAFTGVVQGAGVTPANDRAIWLAESSGVSLCLRERDEIGAMRVVELTGGGSDLQVNDLAQVVVRCELEWVGDTSGSRYNAIVAWTPQAGASIVAVANQPLDLADGSTGAVLSLKLSGTRALNGSGELVFAASLNSGQEDQGIFKANLGSGEPQCAADYDGSGIVAVADIFAFLSAWFAGDADFDGSGTTEVVDIFDFLAAWFRGCP